MTYSPLYGSRRREVASARTAVRSRPCLLLPAACHLPPHLTSRALNPRLLTPRALALCSGWLCLRASCYTLVRCVSQASRKVGPALGWTGIPALTEASHMAGGHGGHRDPSLQTPPGVRKPPLRLLLERRLDLVDLIPFLAPVQARRWPQGEAEAQGHSSNASDPMKINFSH